MEIAGDIIWSGILGSIGWGILGYVIGLLLVIVLSKRGALKRKRWYSKIAVVSYWILIPIIFGVASLAFKTIHYVHTRINIMADAAIEEVEEQTYGLFEEHVSQNIEEYTGRTSLPTNDELLEDYLGVDSTSNWITRTVLEQLLGLIEDQATKQISDNTALQQKDVEYIRMVDTNEMDQVFHGAFVRLEDTVHYWVRNFFLTYYIWVGIIFVVLMIFPIVENLLARRNRRQVKAAIQVESFEFKQFESQSTEENRDNKKLPPETEGSLND